MAKKATTTKKSPATKAKKPATKAKKPASKAKKPAAKSTATRLTKSSKPLTKTGLVTELADKTKLEKKQVTDVFDALDKVIQEQLLKGPGKLTLPFGLKLELKKTPAKPARPGRNPQTGEEIMLKAKPAQTIVKARALKSLRELPTSK